MHHVENKRVNAEKDMNEDSEGGTGRAQAGRQRYERAECAQGAVHHSNVALWGEESHTLDKLLGHVGETAHFHKAEAKRKQLVEHFLHLRAQLQRRHEHQPAHSRDMRLLWRAGEQRKGEAKIVMA